MSDVLVRGSLHDWWYSDRMIAEDLMHEIRMLREDLEDAHRVINNMRGLAWEIQSVLGTSPVLNVAPATTSPAMTTDTPTALPPAAIIEKRPGESLADLMKRAMLAADQGC